MVLCNFVLLSIYHFLMIKITERKLMSSLWRDWESLELRNMYLCIPPKVFTSSIKSSSSFGQLEMPWMRTFNSTFWYCECLHWITLIVCSSWELTFSTCRLALWMILTRYWIVKCALLWLMIMMLPSCVQSKYLWNSIL